MFLIPSLIVWLTQFAKKTKHVLSHVTNNTIVAYTFYGNKELAKAEYVSPPRHPVHDDCRIRYNHSGFYMVEIYNERTGCWDVLRLLKNSQPV